MLKTSQPCKYAVVGADGAVCAKPGAILVGLLCITAGTMAAIYDNDAVASGQVLIPSQALTAGQSFAFPGGVGVQVTKGIFADWTSGSFLVFYQEP